MVRNFENTQSGAAQRHIAGFDVMELCPKEGNSSCAFLAAKLIYKLSGMLYCTNDWRFRCLQASYITNAAATDALSDVIFPFIGIDTR